jgi:hypothetical protein
MIIEILVRKTGDNNLQAFHERLCKLLGIGVGEQRFSDNVAGGTYCRTIAFGIGVRTEEADNRDFIDYDYCIAFKPMRDAFDLGTIEGVADIVAIELALVGIDLVRISTNFKGPESSRIVRRCVIAEGSPPALIPQ